MIVVNNTAAPANSICGAAAKIGIIGRCPTFFAGRVCYTPSGAPETPPIIPRLLSVEKMLVIKCIFAAKEARLRGFCFLSSVRFLPGEAGCERISRVSVQTRPYHIDRITKVSVLRSFRIHYRECVCACQVSTPHMHVVLLLCIRF